MQAGKCFSVVVIYYKTLDYAIKHAAIINLFTLVFLIHRTLYTQ